MEDQSWKKEFYSKNNNFDDILKLLDRQKISHFYKYRDGRYNNDTLSKFSNYDLDNLDKNVLRSSIVSSFNDPFEFCDSIVSREDLIKFICDKFQYKSKEELEFNAKIRNFNTIDEYLNFFYEDLLKIEHVKKDDFLVLCLSSRRDSILMWSHYSNYHRGFCIEYDAKEVLWRYSFKPIIYSDEYPNSLKYNGLNCTEIFKDGSDIYNVKYIDWAYEDEWRYLRLKKGKSSWEDILMPIPSAIYMGCKIDDRLKRDLEKLFKNKIPLYQAKMNKFSYKLEFVREY